MRLPIWKIVTFLILFTHINKQFIFAALEELAIPKCMSDLKDKKAQKGGKTFFTMKIRGEPIPEVSW